MKENRQNQIIFFFPDIKIGGVEKNFFIISNYLTKLSDKTNVLAKMIPVSGINSEQILYKYKNGKLEDWKDIENIEEND